MGNGCADYPEGNMKKLNFNTYMTTVTTMLSDVWTAQRGRMTRKSVEKRAQGYGLPGYGNTAWDDYLVCKAVAEAAFAQGSSGAPDLPQT